MEPRIQYAKTSDGVSIAYWTMGEGKAVVYMNAIPFRDFQFEWERFPELRQVGALLAQRGRSFVQFDARGMGSSRVDLERFSLGEFVADLVAVVDHLKLEQFDLVAVTYSCPIAIAYTVGHPARVSRLALSSPLLRGREALDTPIGRALRALRGQDWEIYTDTAMHLIYGWGDQQAETMAALLRAATTPEIARSVFEAVDTFDVSDLLDRVAVPTLVLYPSGGTFIPVEQARAVAAGIPGAAFATVEATQAYLAIGEFLEVFGAGGGLTLLGTTPALAASTAVMLFADIADSTGLTERLGDAAFRERARALDGALRGVIRENGGVPVDGKLLGDGVLAVFTSARQAIEAALACGRAGGEAGLPLHLGLHAGDVIREEGNVYGGAVNIAARISALSAPGEVLVSDTLRGLARTSAGVSFEDRGERELKGVGEAGRVWAVQGEAS